MQSTSQSGDGRSSIWFFNRVIRNFPCLDSSSPDSTPPQYFEKEKAFVESDLIAAVDPLRKAALQEIFASDAWVYQNAPLDSTKLREMRLHDENDSKLFKCLFSSICSKKIDHNTKALEHLEEHLGHKGYACSEWYELHFPAKDPLISNLVVERFVGSMTWKSTRRRIQLGSSPVLTTGMQQIGPRP
jgi:hypothetical protein